ncbi:MAG: hypothetical protein WBA89_05170 [Microcoleus sp.]
MEQASCLFDTSFLGGVYYLLFVDGGDFFQDICKKLPYGFYSPVQSVVFRLQSLILSI